MNICEERARFAAGFSAALVRGTLSLLPGDRLPAHVAALARSEDNLELSADRVVAVVYTSGSAGAPAPHRECWGALAARSAAAATAFWLVGAPPTLIVSTVPPHQIYGFETTAQPESEGFVWHSRPALSEPTS